MAKIDFETGLTLHFGDPSNNEYIRRSVRVVDFDTELPFDDQVQKIHATFHQLGQWADDQLAEWMKTELGRRAQ